MKRTQYSNRAINALLTCDSIDQAAQQAGISKRTMLRWLGEPSFRQEYARAKADVLKMATGILTRNASRAARKLERIFSSRKNVPHQGPKVAAAIGTLRLAIDAFTWESLEERIRVLEEQGQANEKYRIQ